MNFVHGALTIPRPSKRHRRARSNAGISFCAQFAASKVSALYHSVRGFDSAFRVHPLASAPFSKLLSSYTPRFFKRVVFLYGKMGTPKSRFLQDRAAIMRLLLPPCRWKLCERVVPARIIPNHRFWLTRAGSRRRRAAIDRVTNDILRSTIGHNQRTVFTSKELWRLFDFSNFGDSYECTGNKIFFYIYSWIFPLK